MDETIAKLVGQVRLADQDAMAQLFSIYRDPLLRMIEVRMDDRMRGRIDTSDVLQDSFLEARKRLRHFNEKPELSFLSWLRMIVTQRLVDLHREHLGAQKRNAGVELSLNQSSLCLAVRLKGNDPTPSRAAVSKETLAEIENALDQMDSIDREILILRHFEELSNNDAAEVLGLHKDAASKRYIRALQRFKATLESIPGIHSMVVPKKPRSCS